MFKVRINDVEVDIPLFVAVGFSKTIAKLISGDDTIRHLDVMINFRNKENINKIVSILRSSSLSLTVSLQNDDDIFDFAEFGICFGNSKFIEHLEINISKLENEGINKDNVLRIIKYKDMFSHFEEKKQYYSKELEFISANFNSFNNDEYFISWCKKSGNEDRVENIVSSDSIRLNCEDDLLSFIIFINEDNNRFMHLLQYVHIEFCTADVCETFMNSIKHSNIIQSRHSIDVVFSFLSGLISHKRSIQPDINKLKTRYPKEEIKRIQKISQHKTYFAPVKEEPSDFESNIFKAAEKGKLTSVQYLIEQRNISYEEKDCNEQSLLNIASQFGHLLVVKYLHEEWHADVEAKNKWGNTPINIASENGHLEVV
jgi:hypothetical protein